MHKRIKEWLEECGMTDVQSVNVSIDGVVMPGAIYTSPNHNNQEFVYVVGDHPHTRRRGKKLYTRNNICYRVPGDDRDWYIACYFHPELHKTYFKTEPKVDPKYQPFGNNFLLSPWDIPGKPDDKIDSFEPRPYERKDMTIEAA